jgi:antitoxin HicB
MMQTWTYGVAIEHVDSEYVVSVRDLPEVVTAGYTLQEALDLAADAIEVIVEGRMDDNDDLPVPSTVEPDERAISLPAHLAAKASVYAAWKAAHVSKSELARRLDRNETEVRRILDPHHGTKLDQLDQAARALGARLVIAFEPA